MDEPKRIKPIGGPAYGKIGHLPNSRLGASGDKHINFRDADVCLKDSKHYRIIVQEKLDGSCVAVARVKGELIPITRGGFKCTESYEQHQHFHQWAMHHKDRFDCLLQEGERLVGEWLGLAHGTRYKFSDSFEPFVAFDIIKNGKRSFYHPFYERVWKIFTTPQILHIGGAIPVEEVLPRLINPNCLDQVEGLVYRVEDHTRKHIVSFLAKYVYPGKEDGVYLPFISDKPEVWNWRPD